MWAGGIAAGGSWIAWQRIVNRGFDWLVAACAAALAAAAAWAGAGPWAIVAAILAVGALAAGGRAIPVTVALAGSAICALVAASQLDAVFFAVSGAVALGGVTVEMLLGHWFLVDPRLPRSALRKLALAGVAGVTADLIGTFVRGIEGTIPIAATAALGVLTVLLMVLVYLALREQGYSGVMAATGLSYLGVLTGAGAVAASRAALAGGFFGFG